MESEPKNDSKSAESKLKVDFESVMPEPKEDSQSAKSEPKEDSEPEPEKDSESEPKMDSESEPKRDSESEPKMDSESEPKRDSESEPKRDSESEPKRDSESEPKRDSQSEPQTKEEDEYFTSYEGLEVHQLMLEDGPRTEAYRKAILENKSYFNDKVVMDVGCGTGILSIFCAQAGAKKVYAVEASNVADIAKEIVKENGYENVIEVIHSKVEDVTLPDDIKVDAIVSEWMGFFLLHEGMLDSVLLARDKFLKEGGEMFPESAAIYVAPCSVPSLYNNWNQVYGVAMKTFAKYLRQKKQIKPEIMTIEHDNLLATEEVMCWINLREDNISDLNCYTLQHVYGANKSGCYEGICIWFECNFPQLSKSERIVLDTSPRSPPTHWQQTVIVLPESLEVQSGEPIAFKLDMRRDETNDRRYNIEMEMKNPEEVDHPLPCSCHMTKCILVKVVMDQFNDHVLQE